MGKGEHSPGFVSLHRSILQWGWYRNANTYRLFTHLLLTAEYRERKVHGKTIKRGQRMCSVETLAVELGLSNRQTRTALEHLELTGEVTSKTSPQGTVITVKNYTEYQTPTSDLTNKRQTTDKQEVKRATNKRQTTDKPTSNKEIINNKRGPTPAHPDLQVCGEFKNVLISPEEMDKLKELVPGRYQGYIEQLSGYLASTGKKYKSHYATIRNWIRRDRVSGKPNEEDDSDVL